MEIEVGELSLRAPLAGRGIKAKMGLRRNMYSYGYQRRNSTDFDLYTWTVDTPFHISQELGAHCSLRHGAGRGR